MAVSLLSLCFFKIELISEAIVGQPGYPGPRLGPTAIVGVDGKLYLFGGRGIKEKQQKY